ncbi:MAG: hypothetical protein CSA11_10100, partial [Chloroflexi bacterium]
NQVAGNHFRNRFQQEISSYIDAHTLHDIRTPAEFYGSLRSLTSLPSGLAMGSLLQTGCNNKQ